MSNGSSLPYGNRARIWSKASATVYTRNSTSGLKAGETKNMRGKLYQATRTHEHTLVIYTNAGCHVEHCCSGRHTEPGSQAVTAFCISRLALVETVSALSTFVTQAIESATEDATVQIACCLATTVATLRLLGNILK